jgi:hypothetical protein
MNKLENHQSEDSPPTEGPQQGVARRIVQDYIDDLRELIRKLRGRLH